jgi:hypothetical protein
VTSIDAEKVFDKINYLLMIKTLGKLKIEEKLFKLIKGMHEKPKLTLNSMVKPRILLY